MKMKTKVQITLGIISPLIVWAVPILLSGKIYLFDVIDLGYGNLGLDKAFFVLFAAYNIFTAIYSKNKGNDKFFLCLQITVSIPIFAWIICFIMELTITNFGPLTTAVYILAVPFINASYIFEEGDFWLILSSVVIGLSPLAGFITYKAVKVEC